MEDKWTSASFYVLPASHHKLYKNVHFHQCPQTKSKDIIYDDEALELLEREEHS